MDHLEARHRREPWFVSNLSLLWPGLGQLYLGKIAKGILFALSQLLLSGCLIWMFIGPRGIYLAGILLVIPILGIDVWSIWDAYQGAKRGNNEDFEKERKAHKDPWLAVFLTRILPGLGHLYLRKWVWGIIFLITLFLLRFLTHYIRSSVIAGIPLVIFLVSVCYHAYISSPSRRDPSSRRIIVLLSLILISGLLIPLSGAKKNIKAYKIPSNSMAPKIISGDRVLMETAAKYIPRRGDIIVFRYPEDPELTHFKRVIALGGETVEIKDDAVYINGIKLAGTPFQNIEFVSTGRYGTAGNPYVVPADSLYVLGDNGRNSRDSRFYGAIPVGNVMGKIFKRYWPPSRIGSIE